jgi:magnesium transporter
MTIGLRTSVSALNGSAVLDATGNRIGYVRELAVSPSVDASHVEGLIVRMRVGRRDVVAPLAVVRPGLAGLVHLRSAEPLQDLPEDNPFLMLERDVLDQQIIDVHGHKIVRVNDVDLVWESAGGADDGVAYLLRIVEVEVGLRGAVRRLAKGLPISLIESTVCRLPARVIPWDFVDLIDRDPARRVKLKIEQEKLARMHPSDLADILEELAPAERRALFNSLDEEVAADALEEVEPNVQKTLLESLDSNRVAGIIEEMDPAAAADLLADLPEERSEAILEGMHVEELLEFPMHSAAGRMTTDFVAVQATATVGDVLEALREFEGDVDSVADVFLLDEQEKFAGHVSLSRLLLAGAETPLRELSNGHLVCTVVHASSKRVAELFDKYNLRSLAVLDEERHIAGIIYAEQVITQLRTGR